jgi:hypothetical protein
MSLRRALNMLAGVSTVPHPVEYTIGLDLAKTSDYFYSGGFFWLHRDPSLTWRLVVERRAGPSSVQEPVWRHPP